MLKKRNGHVTARLPRERDARQGFPNHPGSGCCRCQLKKLARFHLWDSVVVFDGSRGTVANITASLY